ncbi:hypothetical protein BDQ17DRAFT_1250699 [Cyathus striatus]|nr:hypothetical protein BDQ17DRAFT_1250699 [Cyathus striatus]
MSTTNNTSPMNLSQTVDKLDSTGVNWVMFRTHFIGAMKAQKVWKHFMGEAKKPMEGSTGPTGLEAWQEKEDLASYLLMQKLPDSILAKYLSKQTVTQMWSGIVTEFTSKSMMMQTNL